MSEIKLNLARKWRSKKFEEIIGQDLSVRMLKNSLFLQQFFPVYLFSGQRGCGKTTTARVFAAALNCERLSEFQKHPQKQLMPCLQCTSCIAMEKGKHPDFIEIDAASHTGVDHVRMLIDSASLLPLMGNKKIYLIDEAHMLSKAAFNALLKILEEPPASVIFMLATTDPHKIIETVRSRCFQLFFRSVEKNTLFNQLQRVCEAESIQYDDAGLHHIIKQTEGSVRDALNLLETVRFSHKVVTEHAVSQLLGRIDDKALIVLFKAALSGDATLVLQMIKKIEWHQYAAPLIWERLLELLRAAVWIKHGVEPDHFLEYAHDIKAIVKDCPAHRITRLMQSMYDRELLFTRTTAKHDVLEMVLLTLCAPLKKSGSDGGSSPTGHVAAVAQPPSDDSHEQEEEFEEVEEEIEEEEDAKGWDGFLHKLAKLDEPLVISVFQQAKLVSHDAERVCIQLSKELKFFNDILEQSKSKWMILLRETFGAKVTLDTAFTGDSLPVRSAQEIRTAVRKESGSSQPVAAKPAKPAPVQNRQQYGRGHAKRQSRSVVNLFPNESRIDVSDTTTWPLAALLQSHLPGTITEIRE